MNKGFITLASLFICASTHLYPAQAQVIHQPVTITQQKQEFFKAIAAGNYDSIVKLHKAGVSMNATDENGITALSYVMRELKKISCPNTTQGAIFLCPLNVSASNKARWEALQKILDYMSKNGLNGFWTHC